MSPGPHENVDTFLAYALKVEQEAALRFGQLADAMVSCGNRDVGKLFRKLSDYSRLHLAEARARSGFREIPKLAPGDFVWPDLESPETAAIWSADPMMGREQGLQVALEAETAGLQYYKAVRDNTSDPEIRTLAAQFVEEEQGHVAELEKWIANDKAGKRLPADR